MNSNIYKGICLAMLTGFCACQSNDDINTAAQGEAVEIAATIAATGATHPSSRTNTEGDGNSWSENDMIVVQTSSDTSSETPTGDKYYFSTTAGSTITWTTATDAAMTAWGITDTATKLVWGSNQTSGKFWAYYPAKAVNADAENSYTTGGYISPDQSELQRLRSVDFMKDEPQTANKGNAVAFNMVRQTAKVNVTLTLGSEYDGKDVEIVFVYIGTYKKWTGDSDELTKVRNITPYCPNENANTYQALVAPTTAAKERAFVTFMLQHSDGSSYDDGIVHTYNVYPVLEAGKAYNVNLKVGKDKVELADDITIGAWGDETIKQGFTTDVTVSAPDNAEAGIYIYYPDGSLGTNVNNAKLSASNYFMVDHIWFPDDKPKIVVYSPYVEQINNGYLTIDRTKEWCYASVNADNSQTVTQLLQNNQLDIRTHYKHLLAKLTVKLKVGDSPYTSATTVQAATYTTADFNIKSGVIAISNNQNMQLVDMTAVSGENGSYEALMIPSTYTKGIELVGVNANNTKYAYKADITLEQGCAYTLTLTLPNEVSSARANTAAQPIWTLSKTMRHTSITKQ